MDHHIVANIDAAVGNACYAFAHGAVKEHNVPGPCLIHRNIPAQAPQALQLICGESGIVPAAFVAILLNVLLPKNDMAE